MKSGWRSSGKSSVFYFYSKPARRLICYKNLQVISYR